MKFEIGTRVRIKNQDIIGFIVEYTEDSATGIRLVTVESEKEMELTNPGDPNVYPAPYPLIDCSPDDLEMI